MLSDKSAVIDAVINVSAVMSSHVQKMTRTAAFSVPAETPGTLRMLYTDSVFQCTCVYMTTLTFITASITADL